MLCRCASGRHFFRKLPLPSTPIPLTYELPVQGASSFDPCDSQARNVTARVVMIRLQPSGDFEI